MKVNVMASCIRCFVLGVVVSGGVTLVLGGVYGVLNSVGGVAV